MRELLEKIAYTAIRLKKGMIYFFDKDGIYNRVSIEQGKEIRLKGLFVCNDGRAYLDTNKLGYITGTNNINLSKKVICKLKVGDNVERLEYYLQNTKLEPRNKPQELDRFITKIENPVYSKSPESKSLERDNVDVFDNIYVNINIVSEWNEDRDERIKYIEKHKMEILQKAIEKVENDKNFQKYKIPINFLKVGRVTLTKSSILLIVLEFKPIEEVK